jgi:DNA-binding NarL/FixJ family response regulator
VTVIRVAVVDDHPVVRDGTAALLDLEPDLEVVITAGSLPELAERLAAAPAQGVDVIVLDIRLGQASGLDLLPQLAAEGSGAPATVVLSAYDYPQYVEAAHRLGAAGYVLKTAPTAVLIEAIRRAAAGGLSFSVRPSRPFGHSPSASATWFAWSSMGAVMMRSAASWASVERPSRRIFGGSSNGTAWPHARSSRPAPSVKAG